MQTTSRKVTISVPAVYVSGTQLFLRHDCKNNNLFIRLYSGNVSVTFWLDNNWPPRPTEVDPTIDHCQIQLLMNPTFVIFTTHSSFHGPCFKLPKYFYYLSDLTLECKRKQQLGIIARVLYSYWVCIGYSKPLAVLWDVIPIPSHHCYLV